MIDFDRVRSAYQTARHDLLAQRVPEGQWVGELSSSALSTATAASALAVVARHTSDEARRGACEQLASRAVQWLVRCQNSDGGWGDTDKSFSNISTTMLVRAALHLAGAAAEHMELLARAECYIDAQGGVPGLRRRYGVDRTFAVPILTNCALAGLVPWSEVSPLPFELACLPHGLLRFLRLSVVSYAIPALVAIGQARYFHAKPLNPIVRSIRYMSVDKSLAVLQQMQPASGGYLEATPLTSFVVMGLAGTGRVEHPVVRGGVNFLLGSARQDGSWPIDTNLATWNTTLAIHALAAASGEVGALDCLDWLLACQHQTIHPLSRAAPGGWGWSDLSGAVPDVDDTAGALLALAILRNSSPRARHVSIRAAAAAGVRWLLQLQNADGGWPTFCRGWGRLPFDRSGCDLTAHALRALHVWRDLRAAGAGAAGATRPGTITEASIETAIQRGVRYLIEHQRPDGSWVPLWFGNQHRTGDENPVYGTAKVLLAFRDLDQMHAEAAQRGLAWLAANRCADGGWGSGPPVDSPQNTSGTSSVEETALAVEALLSGYADPAITPAVEQGLAWLTAAVEQGRHHESAPIGFYFAKLWYYEKMYPLSFAVAALGQAVRRLAPGSESVLAAGLK